MAERLDRIWHNARLATMRQDLPDLGAIEHGLIAARSGRIVFAGARSDFPSDADAAERVDCAGRWITPGLVDCHTHLVFGGNRAHEFELRLKGASYEEIARAGGGILSTVAATRVAGEDELTASALPRLDALIGEGVTTLEIKSGYGLNTETEMRQLSAARMLGRSRPVTVKTTFAGTCCRPWFGPASPTPSMPSWRASRFRANRPGGCLQQQGRWVCRSSCMQISCRISVAQR